MYRPWTRYDRHNRNPLLVFGRVPLFYYVVHWYVLHLVAIACARMRYGRIDFMFGRPPAGVKARTRLPLLSYL